MAIRFKTSGELKITDHQKSGLVSILRMLENGKLKRVIIEDPNAWYAKNRPRPKPTLNFNMGNIFTIADHCNTATCIAGASDLWCGTKFAPSGNISSRLPDDLRELFAPSCIPETSWPNITAKQASRALRSYLTTGRAEWLKFVH